MLDLVLSFLVRAAAFLFLLLPLRISLFIGSLMGRMTFYLQHRQRRMAYSNLRAALSDAYTPGQMLKIVKRLYRNLGMVIAEFLKFPHMGKRYLDKYVEVEGREFADAARAKAKGALVLTSHFGNWELGGLSLALCGCMDNVFVNEQSRFPRLNKILNEYRQLKGARIIETGYAARGLIKGLKENKFVGILADQDGGRAGIFVNFFARPASMPRGISEFAQHTQADVLPAFIARKSGPYHKLTIKPALDILDDASKGLGQFARYLEDEIRQNPHQWLWFQNRWKSTPIRTVLVLSDTKKGHLNQSLAVAWAIARIRKVAGFSEQDTAIKIVNVRFKNSFLKTFQFLCSVMTGRGCQGCMRCLKYCLSRDSYEEIARTYADFIVSCGWNLAAVNVILKYENNAKNIIVMKPPQFLGSSKFNLIITPIHDKPRHRKNVLVTYGAPNLINDEYIKEQSKKMFDEIPGLSDLLEKDKPIIGFLVGGNMSQYKITKALIERVLDGIIKALDKIDGQILVTTSRRTSKEVGEFLKVRLQNNPRCKLLILAKETNPESAVGGILGLCDIAVVSGESISMVSEAASSGKNVLVFEAVERKTPFRNKHKAFIANLAKEGFIVLASAHEIEPALNLILEKSAPPKPLRDNEIIYEAIKKII